ncbi:PepSY domain-containing protein [Microbacteriaceae bacterium VKM Ac-2854]|nr:PepSY domain-containing protein [Microbacteriaceae bacterium VKM Ac-2854]
MRKKTMIIAGSAVAAAFVLGGTGIAFAATDGFGGSDALTGSDLDRASAAAIAEIGGGTVTAAERDDDGLKLYELDLVGSDGTEYEVRLDADFAVVSVDRDDSDLSSSNDSTDRGSTDDSTDRSSTARTDPDDLVGAELQQASDAALAAVGGGTVTEAERSDDADHAFEVEVTRADGTDVDVELDAAFAVVRTDR